jgi:hypothetical protein
MDLVVADEDAVGGEVTTAPVEREPEDRRAGRAEGTLFLFWWSGPASIR